MGTFTSNKINKIRWKPEVNTDAETFVTGSWDNEVNQLTLWKSPANMEEDVFNVYPCVTYIHPHHGDVTEIKFITNDMFLVSSSMGNVKLMKVIDAKRNGAENLIEIKSWSKLHYFCTGEISPCTGLAIYGEDVATVGEDGRIGLLSTRKDNQVRSIDDADSCSLQCVCFLKHNELLTGNLRGQMKVWDLRSQVIIKPETTFMLSGEQIGATCVTVHPTQNHVVLAGGEDGSLTIWDLRHNTNPVSLLSAHSLAVSELQFHPDRPEHLFTCSMSGDFWQWNTSSTLRPSLIATATDIAEENPWLSSGSAKNRMEVLSLLTPLHLPINSFDINKSRAICASDNEAFYLIDINI